MESGVGKIRLKPHVNFYVFFLNLSLMARAVVYMRQHWSRDLKEAGKRATRVSPEAAHRPWGGSVNPESGACQVTARGGRDASVRHPTRCHSQHGQLSGGLQRGSRQSEVGTAQGSGRFPVEPRAGLWRPRPRPAQRCLGRGAGALAAQGVPGLGEPCRGDRAARVPFAVTLPQLQREHREGPGWAKGRHGCQGGHPSKT